MVVISLAASVSERGEVVVVAVVVVVLVGGRAVAAEVLGGKVVVAVGVEVPPAPMVVGARVVLNIAAELDSAAVVEASERRVVVTPADESRPALLTSGVVSSGGRGSLTTQSGRTAVSEVVDDSDEGPEEEVAKATRGSGGDVAEVGDGAEVVAVEGGGVRSMVMTMRSLPLRSWLPKRSRARTSNDASTPATASVRPMP